MEQNMNTTMPAMSSGQQGNGNGLKIATIVASIIAICGIGFGIFGMIQSSQKDSQISDLKVQVQNSDGSVTTIETPKIETTTNDGTVVTITDSAAKDVNSEDYIYVGEWGVKIKIPDNLQRVSYSLRQSSVLNSGETFLWVWGNVEGRLPDFADPSKNSNPLGVIGRLSISSLNGSDCHSETFELVFSDGEYNYCYSHPQGVVSNPDSEPYSLEIDTVELIQQMLKNKNNYSAI